MRNKRALRIISGMGGVVALVALTPSSVFGQDGPSTQAILDNIWVFIAGCLVFFMQAGFALVEAGLTRAKNVVNIFAKNMADAIIGVTAWFATGWAFAFGSEGNDFFGTDQFFLTNADLLIPAEGGLSVATSFFFQAVFAATAVTIASGAMAERTKFSTYLIFATVMCAFIYPVVVHMTWGGGFIAGIEIGDAVYSDFAGSGIVHMTGGVAALHGCVLPRSPHRQVRRRRQAAGDPRSQHPVRHPRCVHPVARLVRLQPRFGARRRQLRHDRRRQHDARRRRRRPLLHRHDLARRRQARRRDDRQRRARRTRRHHRPVRHRRTRSRRSSSVASAACIVVFSVLFFDRIKIDDPVGAISVHGTVGAWGLLSVGLWAHNTVRFRGGRLRRRGRGAGSRGSRPLRAIRAVLRRWPRPAR